MDSTVIDTVDTAIAEVEDAMTVLFARASSSWRDFATIVHPDLQPAGYKILTSLVHAGPTHAGVLAELLSTDKSVMSRQVRCMQDYGLIESHPDPVDGRARVLAATADAKARIEAARATNAELFRDQLRTWPREDVERLACMIGRLGT